MVGQDFRFGKNEGSVDLLRSYQHNKKIGLTVADPFIIQDKVVSSSVLDKN